jgi:hypothetical protein
MRRDRDVAMLVTTAPCFGQPADIKASIAAAERQLTNRPTPRMIPRANTIDTMSQ